MLRALVDAPLEPLLLGHIAEDAYWESVLALAPRQVPIPELRRAVRENFAQPVPGMPELVLELAKRHRLVLHSDHAAEWIDDVLPMHPFLSEAFESMFFSYALGSLKTSSASFHAVLRRIGETPRDCLFIDDNPTNVATALSIGLPSIRFQDVGALRAALHSHLDPVVP